MHFRFTEQEIIVGSLSALAIISVSVYIGYKNLHRLPVERLWKQLPRPLRQAIVLVIGLTLILIGTVLIVLPGPFTMPFVIAGLFVLALEFAWAERILVESRNQARKIDPRKLLKRNRKSS